MRVLMLEDDIVLAELVSAYLLAHVRVDVVNNLAEAKEFIAQLHYDVVLLDRNIHGEDVGLNLVAEIKSKNPATGIIVISAYDSIADKIEGLNLGADDYLDKPFDNDELLARIYALGRRNQPLPQLHIEGLLFDTNLKTIEYEKKSVSLTKKESDLLFYLIKKRGQIVSKDELLDALYINPQNISSNTIDVTIGHIRKKLPVSIIKTVKTRGYIVE
ncbi:MAG: response regulator transcription factor [Sulfurimonas sp.]|nr:response regulator transcription factor [Sulfurimonas sp.]MBU1216314.1 response regulator transcription factor [bacterium]MBU1434620.1 response regulator transcription factor [bacterium]MBU1502198.1 response regulator transcription factor [bacterium]MBU3939696.1 response regulator transcription factor [bacterium]